MNSAVLGYQLPTFTGLVRHSSRNTLFLRDSDERSPSAKLTLEAQVRSGDYFINLATTLDSLARDMADYNTRLNLEDLVSDLIYLQDNYTITKNTGH
jgi:hypothetical protein